MLLYQDNILSLEYDPTTDIIEIAWPDLEPLQLPEIKQSLQVMVESVRNYDVKKMLVDASKANIAISQEENTLLSLSLAKDLNATRVQKIARIESKDNFREIIAQSDVNKIQSSLDVKFQMRNFPDRSSAMSWLKASI